MSVILKWFIAVASLSHNEIVFLHFAIFCFTKIWLKKEKKKQIDKG